MKNANLYRSAVLMSTFGLLLTGCKGRDPNMPAPIVDGNASASDPANANLLPTQVAGVSYAAMPQSSATSYAPAQYPQGQPQQAQQGGRVTQNESTQYNMQPPAGQPQDGQQQQGYDPNAQGYDPNAQGPPNGQGNPDDQQAANAAEYDEYQSLLDPNVPAADQPPPELPSDYEQPDAPGPDYMWTPGYWDNASSGYYYVPGVWVSAPYQGALWTPGWWGYYGNRYRWHHGYWGRHVGYYGGINYGFGYIGFGYEGGYWNGSHFWYNTAVNRVRPQYVNNYVYNRRVEVANRAYVNNTRISYVGPRGLNRRPTAQEFAAMREQHTAPMQAQMANRRAAEQNRAQFFNQNHGRPGMVVASHGLAADHNITPPPRTMPAAGSFNGHPGVGNRPGGAPANTTPQQRQQFEQQFEQQRQGLVNQQHVQQQQQPGNMNPQQRQQFERGQQRVQEQQHQPGTAPQQTQQRQQMEQQRQQQEQLRQQPGTLQNQQHMQVQEQQRQQVEQQQRNQGMQQRFQQEQQQQRSQQEQQQRPQSEQMQRQEVQRQEQPRPEVQRAAPPPQMHNAPAPQMHSAPPPQVHAAPEAHGGGEHHR